KRWEFRSKPVWQRIVVITAGVILNLILAVAIYGGITYSIGEPEVKLDSLGSVYIPEGSLADQVGFETGDKLVGVNGEEVPFFSRLMEPDKMTSFNCTLQLNRSGLAVSIARPDTLLNEVGIEGLVSALHALPIRISSGQKLRPADVPGLQ